VRVDLLLEMATEACPDRIAVGGRTSGRTMAQLRRDAEVVATQLVLREARRLVYAGVNSDSCPALLFGAALAGVPFTGVNYRLPDDRLRAVIERAAPAVLVADDATAKRLPPMAGVAVVEAGALVDDDGSTQSLPQTDPLADDVAISLFTSGTTGEPKEVLLRHRNLFSYVTSTCDLSAASASEAALVSVPPYHIAGLSAILSNIYLCRRVVYIPQFDASEWVRTAAAEQVTHAMIVPTMLGRILDALQGQSATLPHLRHLSYGGGRMPLPVIERALGLLPGVDFVNAYGLTETSSTITVLGPTEHRAAVASADPVVRARLGSVGRALPGVEIEIRTDDGTVAAPDEVGELFVRGPQVSGEYAGRQPLVEGGWFATRDLARTDSEGFVYLEGRADDVIVRGGENLSPGEIEDVLVSHPAVSDAAVVGVPDTEWGEVPVAVVVLSEPGASTADLHEWLRGRLRASRSPRAVVAFESLPYSETGKLLRRVVRDDLIARSMGAD
jgi:acyl-CoA synthetase (AMP-forming)/AMP-acid ligase II